MIGKILAVGFVCAGAAFGQTATAPAAAGAPAVANSAPTSTATPAPAATAAAAPTRAYAFDAVSIRPNKTPATVAVLKQDGPTADGYRSHQPLALLLLTAYVPQVGGAAFYTIDQIKGLPDWMMSDGYDIDARIADEDRTEWQKPEMQKVMLRAMLQAMLAERCKLAVHRELKETQCDHTGGGQRRAEVQGDGPDGGASGWTKDAIRRSPGRSRRGRDELLRHVDGLVRVAPLLMGEWRTPGSGQDRADRKVRLHIEIRENVRRRAAG
jgi:hypothetical protein